MKNGKVYLVGAGPGDPELLTLQAARLLKRAEVVLYDKLVAAKILDFAPKTALKINVGKKRGRFDQIQSRINRLMVQYARRGKTVIRLKGGDPLVFGRAGEEIDCLRRNNIPCRLIPGVSSATGAPTAAGIPLIWPGLSASFAIATGHPRAGRSASAVPVPKADTLVYLMGIKNLKNVLAALRAAHYPASTPVALIQSGTTARERVLVTSIGHAGAQVRRDGMRPPAVIVVGKTVLLRRKA